MRVNYFWFEPWVGGLKMISMSGFEALVNGRPLIATTNVNVKDFLGSIKGLLVWPFGGTLA